MAIFPFLKKKKLLNPVDEAQVVNAIRIAEKNTSGEVRVFIENRCRFVNPVDRALEVFFGLKMEKTLNRNGVLVYVALKDKQLAIFGDEAIHNRVGEKYWKQSVQNMLQHFSKENHVQGICDTVLQIGETLSKEFPYNNKTDKNELPDDIVFGD